MGGRRLAAVAGIVLLSCAGPARAASQPRDHAGFFIGFNLGAGAGALSLPENGDTGRDWGSAAGVRLGGAVRNDLLLGVEGSVWMRKESGQRISLSTLVFAATYYPGESGWFARGGAGLAMGTYDPGHEPGVISSFGDSSDLGFAIQVATGYEWHLTEKFALGPQVELVYLNFGGEHVDTANFFDATLGFNWYW